jgi:hypothetical protein
MKPKTINLITILALCTLSQTCRAQDDPPFSTRVAVSISDDDKIPVAGADVLIAYLHAYDGKRDRKHEGQTDAAGQYEAKDWVNGSVLLRASKDGHYPLDFERVLIRMNVDWQKIKNIELPLVMRQIKQPVPLYARKFSAVIPAYEQPIGFDFEAGDWVAPLGKGKIPDMLLNFNRKLVGYIGNVKHEDMVMDLEKTHRENPRLKDSYFESLEKSYGKIDKSNYDNSIDTVSGKWDGKTIITFPHPQEGIANAAKDYCHYSALTLPHQAYWKGYSESLSMVTDNYTPKNTPPVPAYFVRTRVILDDKGEIISANYAKITSPIYFDPRGRIEFTYVFNPTPNDRNLEFDTNRNLFGELDLEQRVTAP